MMILTVIATICCALLAVQATRLLISTLWLAAVSALVALLLYRLGAYVFAVIELSVGAGLVTVLIVFAITMIGDERENVTQSPRNILVFALAPIAILLALLLPLIENAPNTETTSVTTMLWQQRDLDVMTQIAVIFAGVLGVLNLLHTRRARKAIQNTDTEVPMATVSPLACQQEDQETA